MKGVFQRRNIQDKYPQSMFVAAQVVGRGKWPAGSPQRNIRYCVTTNIIRATQIAALSRHGKIPCLPQEAEEPCQRISYVSEATWEPPHGSP